MGIKKSKNDGFLDIEPLPDKKNFLNGKTMSTEHLNRLGLIGESEHFSISDTINQSSEYLNNPMKHNIPICQQTIYPSKQFLMLHEILERFGEFYDVTFIRQLCKNYNHKAISLNGIGREQNVKIATAHMDATAATNISSGLLDFLKPKPTTQQPIK